MSEGTSKSQLSRAKVLLKKQDYAVRSSRPYATRIDDERYRKTFGKIKDSYRNTSPGGLADAGPRVASEGVGKKRVAYWWAAAAVVLLGVAITWLGLENQNLVPRVAQQAVTDSVTVSKEVLIVDNQVVTKDADIDSESELKSVTETPNKHPSAMPAVSDVEPSLLSDELSIKIPSPSTVSDWKERN